MLSMVAFSHGADEIDEGVNVTAVYLSLLALPLTIATIVVAARAQHDR